MTADDLKALIRTVPDFPAQGIMFRDITTLLANGEGLTAAVEMIAQRADAKASKNFAEADRIRAELTALNVEVMDNASGATWRIRDKV